MMICPLSYVKSWRPGKTAAAACIKNKCAWWDDSRQCCAAKQLALEQKETDGVHTAEEAAKWFFHRAVKIDGNTPEARACEFALSALSEQLRKGKGCDYCKGNPNLLEMQYGLDHILPEYKFCPMCGRRLEAK